MFSHFLLLDAILLVSTYAALPTSSNPKHSSTSSMSLPIRKRAPFFDSRSSAADIDRNIWLRDKAVRNVRLRYGIAEVGAEEGSTTLGLLSRREALQPEGSLEMGDSEGDMSVSPRLRVHSDWPYRLNFFLEKTILWNHKSWFCKREHFRSNPRHRFSR